jgi:hypothetical protein
MFQKFSLKRPTGQIYYRTGLANAAPVIYFPGAPLYSAGFNVNQNLKNMFQFFS